VRCRKNTIIFSQGEIGEAVSISRRVESSLSWSRSRAKKPSSQYCRREVFSGEGCFAGQPVCMATETVEDDASLMCIEKAVMVRAMHAEPDFFELFLAISWVATFASKKTWWTISSIPARNGWRGCCF
jgi:hypothetical protein